MIVVEVQDDRVERETLVAPLRTSAAHLLETIEETMETRADRVGFVRIARQRVCAFVGRAERAGAAGFRKVLAEGLRRATPCAFLDRVGELDLIDARHLMHTVSCSLRWAHSTLAPGGAHLSGTERHGRTRAGAWCRVPVPGAGAGCRCLVPAPGAPGA